MSGFKVFDALRAPRAAIVDSIEQVSASFPVSQANAPPAAVRQVGVMCVTVHTAREAGITFLAGVVTRCPMSDVYVYYFHPFTIDGVDGSRSLFAATLSAIQKLGYPIMESQIVIDGSEVSEQGILIPTEGFGSEIDSHLSAKIRTLELRAAARDRQARSMNESTDGAAIYLLGLESRHLREKAQELSRQRAEAVAGELGHIQQIVNSLSAVAAPQQSEPGDCY